MTISLLWLLVTGAGTFIAATNIWDARLDLIAVKHDHLLDPLKRTKLMVVASANLMYQELIGLALVLDVAAGVVSLLPDAPGGSVGWLAILCLVASAATLTVLSIAQRHWRDVEMASLDNGTRSPPQVKL